MKQIVNAHPSGTSPFDAIKRTRPDGSHYWSARDMQPLMGYSRWNEFKNPIERAMKAAENQGFDPELLFRRSAEKSGGRPSEDFELTRFAAYLVAMNGDPNKPEVAAAQAYFAVKTHEAEQGAYLMSTLGGQNLGYASVTDSRTEHQLNAVIFQARAQMELCQAAKGLIHPDHLEARARIVLARGLGEKPELDSGHRPLYTQDFLKEKNLSASRMKSVSGVFGKRVKAAYVLKYGRDPERYPLNLPNGQVREVNAYTEADRPLLEQVWNEHYADGAA